MIKDRNFAVQIVQELYCYVDRSVDRTVNRVNNRRSYDLLQKLIPFLVPWGQNSLNLYLSVPSTCCRTDGGHFGSFLNLSECQKGTEEFIHKDGCHAKVNGHIQTAQETTKVFNPIFLSQ